MFNRKRLDRERLEVYLVHLLLAYRHLILICGALLLIYAIAMMGVSPISGSILAVIAAVPLLVASSYKAVVVTARLGAWISTLGTKE